MQDKKLLSLSCMSHTSRNSINVSVTHPLVSPLSPSDFTSNLTYKLLERKLFVNQGTRVFMLQMPAALTVSNKAVCVKPPSYSILTLFIV